MTDTIERIRIYKQPIRQPELRQIPLSEILDIFRPNWLYSQRFYKNCHYRFIILIRSHQVIYFISCLVRLYLLIQDLSHVTKRIVLIIVALLSWLSISQWTFYWFKDNRHIFGNMVIFFKILLYEVVWQFRRTWTIV